MASQIQALLIFLPCWDVGSDRSIGRRSWRTWTRARIRHKHSDIEKYLLDRIWKRGSGITGLSLVTNKLPEVTIRVWLWISATGHGPSHNRSRFDKISTGSRGAILLVLLVFSLSNSSQYLAPFHPILAHVKRRTQSHMSLVSEVHMYSWGLEWKTESFPLARSLYF